MPQQFNPLSGQFNLSPDLTKYATLTGVASLVTNMAALRTLVPQNNQIVFLSGYYTEGFGAGYFKGSTSLSTTDDGGSVIRVGAGGWTRIKTANTECSVLDFGVKSFEQGGTDSDAIANALAVNRALAWSDRVWIPANCSFAIPLSRATVSLGGSDALTLSVGYNAIYVPANKRLSGVNKRTSIIKAAATTSTPSAGSVVALDSGATLDNLTIDGNKDNITGTGSWSNWLVRTAPMNRTNCTFQNLIVKNVAAVNDTVESFGISTLASDSVLVTDCEIFNVRGTGLHLDGDYLNGYPGKNNRAIRIKAYNCDWMGISCYGLDGGWIQDCELNNNGTVSNGHGLNFEWARNVTAVNCRMTGNGGAGLGGYGAVNNVRIYQSEISKNCTNSPDEDAEILFRGGSWYASLAGQANPPRGIAYQLEMHDCMVIPSSGKAHVKFLALTGTAATGGVADPYAPAQSEVADFLINCEGAETWVYRTTDTLAFPQGLRFGSKVRTRSTPGSMALTSKWTINGSLTMATYSSGGNKSTDAVTLTTTAANASISQTLRVGQTYLATIRYRNINSNTWILNVQKSTIDKVISQQLSKITADASIWYSRQFIFTVPNDGGSWQINLQSTDSTATLDLDFLRVEEIITDSSLIQGIPDQVGNVNPLNFAATKTKTTFTQNDGSGTPASSTFQIDSQPENSTVGATVSLFRNTQATDGQFIVYVPGSSSINHVFSGKSDTFFNQNQGRIGMRIPGGFQGGISEGVEVNGIFKIRNNTGTTGLKLGAPARMILQANAALNATTLSVRAVNSGFNVSTNAEIYFGATRVVVTAGTLISSTVDTTLSVSAISAAITSGTVSSPINAGTAGDRVWLTLSNNESGSTSGSDISLIGYNDSGTNTGAGGAILWTHFIRRATGYLGLNKTNPVCALDINGGIATAIITVTAATYNITTNDSTIICNPTAAQTLTLPAASTNIGRTYIIKNISAQTITITPAGTDTIETGTLAANTRIWLQCDSTRWHQIG